MVPTLTLRARQAEAEITSRMNAIHERSHRTYGAPRVHTELEAEGIQAGAQAGGVVDAHGRLGRREPAQVDNHHSARPPCAAGARSGGHGFVAPGPASRLWVADITYIPTWAGFLYLAVVLERLPAAGSMGWAMETHLRTELVLEALNMALGQRRPTGVIHHSDQGTQYTSIAFGMRCQEVWCAATVRWVQSELLRQCDVQELFATLSASCSTAALPHSGRGAHGGFGSSSWYNPHRRHSALDYLSPINYEPLLRGVRPQALRRPVNREQLQLDGGTR